MRCVTAPARMRRERAVRLETRNLADTGADEWRIFRVVTYAIARARSFGYIDTSSAAS